MPVLDLSVYKPVPATLGDANQIASGFTAIQTTINGLDNNNFAAGKIFDPLKLMQDGATNGQGLVWSSAANGGTGGWVPAAAGAVTLIVDSVASGTVASFDTNALLGGNIPQTFKHLRLVISARCDGAGSYAECQFNGDTTIGNYLYGEVASRGSVANNNGGSAFHIGFAASSTETANVFGETDTLIADYTAAKHTVASGASAVLGAAVAAWVGTVGLRWANVAAVTRIVVLPNLGNFVAGTRFSLYGVN